jgi:hypothetical protein
MGDSREGTLNLFRPPDGAKQPDKNRELLLVGSKGLMLHSSNSGIDEFVYKHLAVHVAGE